METTVNFLLLLCATTLVAYSTAVDYCDIKCPDNTKHTMCMYEDKPAKACTNYYSSTLTDAEKKELLETHNKFRQKVAAGKEKRGKPGPQPPATNMHIMTWDNELARIAQRWANQCDFGHDKCRNTEKYRVGQNVGSQSITGDNTFPMSTYVQDWYDEVEFFNPAQVSNVTEFNNVGHYTQVVWALSDKLGCGVMKYLEPPNWNTTFVVCNYGPAGNWYSQPLYKVPKKADKEKEKEKEKSTEVES